MSTPALNTRMNLSANNIIAPKVPQKCLHNKIEAVLDAVKRENEAFVDHCHTRYQYVISEHRQYKMAKETSVAALFFIALSVGVNYFFPVISTTTSVASSVIGTVVTKYSFNRNADKSLSKTLDGELAEKICKLSLIFLKEQSGMFEKQIARLESCENLKKFNIPLQTALQINKQKIAHLEKKTNFANIEYVADSEFLAIYDNGPEAQRMNFSVCTPSYVMTNN